MNSKSLGAGAVPPWPLSTELVLLCLTPGEAGIDALVRDEASIPAGRVDKCVLDMATPYTYTCIRAFAIRAGRIYVFIVQLGLLALSLCTTPSSEGPCAPVFFSSS